MAMNQIGLSNKHFFLIDTKEQKIETNSSHEL
jgi:hypothetical protein